MPYYYGGNTYYAVAIGRQTGIFTTWGECKTQVNDFPGHKYKKCKTLTQAQDFINENSETVKKGDENSPKQSKEEEESCKNKCD